MNTAQAIAALRQAGLQAFVACTGAGAGLQQLLWSQPGTSDFLVGAAFPYAERETRGLLGFAPERYCNGDTALELAMAAYRRAWTRGSKQAVGLGLTAVVASECEHRGAHRVYVATLSRQACRLYSAVLDKGVGVAQRRRDGELCDLLGLHALLRAAELPAPAVTGVELHEADASARALELFWRRPCFREDGSRAGSPPSAVHLPGSFDPPHEGHWEIANRLQRLGRDCLFSICVDPPHKPALSLTDMLERAELLAGHDRLFTRGDPLYLDKAKAWRCDLALGTDALKRMLDPRWGIDPGSLLQRFAELRCHLFVAERIQNGQLLSLADCGVPPQFGHLFSSLGCSSAQSSTALRQVGTGSR